MYAGKKLAVICVICGRYIFPLISLMYAEKKISDNLRYLREIYFPADFGDVRRKKLAKICVICGI